MPHYPYYFFFLNDTATTEIYPLPLHDALPISAGGRAHGTRREFDRSRRAAAPVSAPVTAPEALKVPLPPGKSSSPERSEEHTSELQSRLHLVCRLLLEKKKKARASFRHIPLHD